MISNILAVFMHLVLKMLKLVFDQLYYSCVYCLFNRITGIKT